jgi:hypothetical protein
MRPRCHESPIRHVSLGGIPPDGGLDEHRILVSTGTTIDVTTAAVVMAEIVASPSAPTHRQLCIVSDRQRPHHAERSRDWDWDRDRFS